jgi:hypothetical protein
MRAEDINYLRRFGDTCDAESGPRGHEEPCKFTPVGAVQGRTDTLPWAACVDHLAQNVNDAVALLDLIGGKP